MNETIAVRVRYKSVYISFPVSAKQVKSESEMTSWTTVTSFSYFHLEFDASLGTF